MIENISFDLLVVDSDDRILSSIENLFSSQGYNVLTAKSVGEALQLLAVHTPQVIITEIMFDSLSPAQIVTAIRRQSFGSVIIAYSNEENYMVDKDFYLEPVFRKLNKPTDDAEIQSTFNDAMHSFFENFTLQGISDQSNLQKRQLNHILLQQTLKNKDQFSFYLSILENIRHSVTQGMGLGGLITSLDMSQFSSERKDGKVIIDEVMFDDILKEKQSCSNWIDLLNQTKENLEASFEPEKILKDSLKDILTEAINSVENIRVIGDHQIILEGISISEDFFSNKELLASVLQELLLNALKYSPAKSVISISVKQVYGHISVSISNEEIVTTGVLSGIPKSLEEKVFEPFFRVNNTFNEKYGQFSLGLGIGLTFVKNALNRINSKIFIHSGLDKNSKIKINVEVNIPTTEIARIKKVNKTELLTQ